MPPEPMNEPLFSCAGCGGPLRPDTRYPSLSRTDNETMVCCICGEMEALMAAGFDHATARAITDATETGR